MVEVIDRWAVQGLLESHEAQLVEVLPLPQYAWAHLPQAAHLPLEELPESAADRLTQSRPIIVYCHDSLCDRSPRAARLLERLGFHDVFDYAAGKMDWLSADLPYDGEAALVSRIVRHDPVIASAGDAVSGVEPRVVADPAGVAVVVGEQDVVLGVIGDQELKGVSADTRAEQIMRVEVPTVRPSEEIGALRDRMDRGGLAEVVVTMPDGRLVGIVSTAAVRAPGHEPDEVRGT
jgi:rhodanese-related sulfurtransferase